MKILFNSPYVESNIEKLVFSVASTFNLTQQLANTKICLADSVVWDNTKDWMLDLVKASQTTYETLNILVNRLGILVDENSSWVVENDDKSTYLLQVKFSNSTETYYLVTTKLHPKDLT